MRFYTEQECEGWLSQRKRLKPDETPGLLKETVEFPPEFRRFTYLAFWIAKSVLFREPALLWITEWDIWNEYSLHLYYKFRQSYSDFRLLEDAPGHLFLGHEEEDLSSFLQVAMMNGWDGYVVPTLGHRDVFFSHDEFVNFYSKSEEALDEVRKVFGDLIYKPKPPDTST